MLWKIKRRADNAMICSERVMTGGFSYEIFKYGNMEILKYLLEKCGMRALECRNNIFIEDLAKIIPKCRKNYSKELLAK
jgi:hypothetical protein